MIPKIIHYCWLSGDPIPENLKKCMESWKKFLPDYEFMLWDRNRFDINSTLWTKQAFEAKKYAFAADYIRLYAVYNYGGIYMDMDIEVLKSFNDLLSREFIVGYEKEEAIEAGIFGAEKGAAWVKQCLSYYDDRAFVKDDNTLDTKPLPGIMYSMLPDSFDKSKILSYDYLTAKSYKTGVIKVTKNTYSIHHFAGSWVSRNEKIKKYLYNKIEKNEFLFYLYKIIYKRNKKNV